MNRARATRSRQRAQSWGVVAEYLCMALLLAKGYTLLGRRHRNKMGEIDIVAVQGKTLVCIEVKARAHMIDALESVTLQKRERTERAAVAFIAANNKYAQHGLRFDVMVVTSPWKIRHLKNAWSR